MQEEFWTDNGVRLRVANRKAGDLNWLFLPGGPGIGSESLQELVDAVEVPGSAWLVDLPGDGSNTGGPGGGTDPYRHWPGVLIEGARALSRPVVVGHSTGGMYLLSTPELAPLIEGMALVSTAPNADWLPRYVAMTEHDPLPPVSGATSRFEANPSKQTLRDLAVSSAPWNFTPMGLSAGEDLLGRMPYNLAAVEWSAENFDSTYVRKWWPAGVPTLIVSGGADRIVDQTLWADQAFGGANVIHRTITGGGHFPWIEQPVLVQSAFAELADAIG